MDNHTSGITQDQLARYGELDQEFEHCTGSPSNSSSRTDLYDGSDVQSEFTESELYDADPRRMYYPMRDGRYTVRWWKCACELCLEVETWEEEHQTMLSLERWFHANCFANLPKLEWPMSGSSLSHMKWIVRDAPVFD